MQDRDTFTEMEELESDWSGYFLPDIRFMNENNKKKKCQQQQWIILHPQAG